MLARGLRFAAIGLLAVCLTGCGLGLIYTHVTVPLDVNLEEEPVPPDDLGRHPGADWKTLHYIVRFDWDSAAIIDAAHAAGLTKVYYADMEVLSVFFGIWEQRTAKVYGTGP